MSERCFFWLYWFFFFFLSMLCSLQPTKGSEVRALEYLYRTKSLSPPPLFSTPSGCFWCYCLLAFVPPPGDVLLYCIVHMLQCGSGAEEGVGEMHCVSGWNTNLGKKVKNEVWEFLSAFSLLFSWRFVNLINKGGWIDG